MRHPRLPCLAAVNWRECGCDRGDCQYLHAQAGIVLVAIKLTIVGAALGFGSTCLSSMLRVASRRLALPCLRPCLEKAVSTVEWTGQFGLVRALQPGLSAVSMLTCVKKQ